MTQDRMECEIEPKPRTYFAHWMLTLASLAVSIAVGAIANYEAGETARDATVLAQKAANIVDAYRMAAQQAQAGIERAQAGWERCIAAAQYVTPTSAIAFQQHNDERHSTELHFDTARCHIASSNLVLGHSYVALTDGCWIDTTCR